MGKRVANAEYWCGEWRIALVGAAAEPAGPAAPIPFAAKMSSVVAAAARDGSVVYPPGAGAGAWRRCCRQPRCCRQLRQRRGDSRDACAGRGEYELA